MRRILTATLAAVLALPLVAAAQEEPPPPGFEIGAPAPSRDLDRLDPVRFDYDDAVVEWAQVTARNGVDRIWVDVIRPDTDEPVPTILISSPYYNTLGRGWRGQLKTPHFGPSYPTSPGFPLFSGDEEVPFPEWYDEYFVPRGYAVALMDLRGTRNTSGCQVYGDRDEVFDAVDVVDWIAEQPWSSGKVGMTGGSYDGTIAIGAAAEQPISGRHPDALAAVIPIRAIDRWYDYHFFNGVQSLGHTLTPALFTAALAAGDTQNAGPDDPLVAFHLAERKACIATFGAATDAGYASPYQDATADFWAERSFQKDAAGMRAAMFLIHGLFDFNVKTNNTGYLWESLPEDLPKKLWFMNGDHVDPHVPDPEAAEAGGHILPFPFQDRFIEWTHRWYLEFLKGVDADATDGPAVEVQRRNGAWQGSDVFPTATRDLELGFDEPLSWRDSPFLGATSATYVTEPLRGNTRISGQFGFDLLLTAQGPDTTVAVEILALPPGAESSDRATETWTKDTDQPLRIGYGWARAWYRDSVPLRGVSTPTDGSAITPGEPFRLQFGSLYTDLVVPAKWRLAFEFSNAATTWPAGTGGTVTLDPAASRILVPTVSNAGPK